MEKRGISDSTLSTVSEYRRGVLESESDITSGNGSYTAASNMTRIKTASDTSFSGSIGSTGGAGGYRGGGGTVTQTPEIYSPLWLTSNMSLPRDQASINAWCRSFFALNPVVKNAIELHSTYPISKLNIKCKNQKANAFFEDMIDELDLLNVCIDIAREYWTVGESFIYTELNDSTAKWSRIVLQNPDYMEVKRSVIAGEPIISLRPDENLIKTCTGNRPADVQQRQQMSKSIIEHVRRGESIPMSNFYITHLANKISPYSVRGTGLPVSCFRSLMLWDKIKECKFVQADTMINPLTLIKVGGGVDNYKPVPADLEKVRELFEQAEADKHFKIISHDGLAVEIVNQGAGIYDTTSDIAQCMKEIYIGLMVPQVIMDTGDITYANGTVSLDVLKGRYLGFRRKISHMLRQKIFAPISKINDFYDKIDGKNVLVVPEIEWNHMSLFDMGDYIQQLTTLLTAEPRKVSTQTVYKSLGLEYEDEQRKIRQENIDFVINAKEMETLQKMDLNALRALGEGDEIQEIKDNPLPGEGSPMGDMGGGMGGGLPGTPGGGLMGGFGGGASPAAPPGGGMPPPSGGPGSPGL